MTNCSSKKLSYKPHKGKKVESDWRGGDITSDSGALLIRQVEDQIGLLESVSKVIVDGRHKSYVRHEVKQMLIQRVFGIALGYEDLNDHDTLRRDSLMKVSAGKALDETLASSPTLHRFENSITRQEMFAVHRVIVEKFIESFDEPPEELILDFDATDDLVHGTQEFRFYHGYYGNYCFLPLYVFCGDRLLTAYLRPSDIDPAKHFGAILKLLVSAFRRAWPEVRIVVRGDSSFCRYRVLDWCDSHDISYIIGISNNNILKELSADYTVLAEMGYVATGEKTRLFGEFRYAASTWKRRRRVIVKAERLARGMNTRFVVTNIEGSEPEQIYDQLYVKRGDMENRIKEQQLHLFADRTSNHEFIANQFRLLLSSLAYILLEQLRRVGLRGTEFVRTQCETLRLKFFKIGAVIRFNSRRIMFHMSASYPYKKIFELTVSALSDG
jgi:hypothetical protein